MSPITTDTEEKRNSPELLAKKAPAYPDRTPMAQDELALLPDDGYRYEWWNGELRVSPSASCPHQRCLTKFCSYLAIYMTDNGHGEAFQEEDVDISAELTVRPDFVLILAEKVKQLPRSGAIPFVPDGVGEVILPGGEYCDQVEKKALYEQIGARWYFLLDNEARTLKLYTLEKDRGAASNAPTQGGRYGEPQIWQGDAIFTLDEFPGLKIPLEKVWF